jgi:integrase
LASISTYHKKNREKMYRVRWRWPDGSKGSKSFSRRKDAERARVEIERRLQLGDLYQESPQTFGEFVGLRVERGRVIADVFPTTWLGRYSARVRASSFERRKAVMVHLAELVPLRLDVVTNRRVEDIVATVAADHPRTAQILLQTIKDILRSAKARGQRVSADVFDIAPPRAPARERRFLTRAEVDMLADSSTEPGLIRFAALTGLRQGELFALTDDDIGLGDRTVIVRSSKTAAGRRTVPLVSAAREVLADQRRARPEGSGLLFASRTGQRWNKDNFNHRVFKPAVARAGLDPGTLTFHDLRHTFASLLIAAGTERRVLQELLGHKDSRATDIYSHLYEGATAAAIDEFDRYLQQHADHERPISYELGESEDREVASPSDGAYRDRTGDLRLAKPALSQLS